MRERAEWRAALCAMLAMSGTGLSSGRELALFFGQLREVAWVGIPVASALFGLLVAGAVSRGQVTLHRNKLDRLCRILRRLLAALVSVYMLKTLGDMGAMTLPLRHGFAFGAAFGLLSALALTRMKHRWAAGLFVVVYVGAFYAACAADPTPARVYARTWADFTLANSVPAALAMALAYAALNACAAAWGLRNLRPGAVRPLGVGLRCAGLMCLILSLGNLALLRGGDAVIVHPAPWVALSARWGLVGFYLCAGLQALCAAATLSVSFSTIIKR